MDLKQIQMSMEIGSEKYNRVSAEVKQFLQFNGYEQTLKSIEEEEVKILAEKQK